MLHAVTPESSAPPSELVVVDGMPEGAPTLDGQPTGPSVAVPVGQHTIMLTRSASRSQLLADPFNEMQHPVMM